MRVTYILLALAVFTSASVLSAQAPAARDYSFPISTTQIWTDTGVDLAAGDIVAISATMPAGSAVPDRHAVTGNATSCDPQGTKGTSEASLPAPSAFPGTLIARTDAQGAPVVVGSSKEMEVEAAGHLFLGVNNGAAPACTGTFAVKVRITPATAANGSTPAAAALTSRVTNAPTATAPVAAAPASAMAAGSTKPGPETTPAAPLSTKEKLSAAAQTWIAGQFGTKAVATPAASDAAISGNGATTGSSTPATPVITLKVSDAPLDATLRKEIDGLPRRVNDLNHNQGDMVNFVLVGNQKDVEAALDAATWHVADTDSKEAALKAILDTYQKKDYLQMPMSRLYLFGRAQDYGYEMADPYAVVASRHHFRLWKTELQYNKQVVWAGAGTHDIGFEKDQRNGKVTHKIDPAVDGERENIGASLQKAGKVKSMSYYLPPNPVQDARNATGGGYHSDGKILVIFLQ